MEKIRVVIDNKQKNVKIPTGLRMLVRRCCNAVLRMENFQGPAEISVTAGCTRSKNFSEPEFFDP